jgi:hypothetical protein
MTVITTITIPRITAMICCSFILFMFVFFGCNEYGKIIVDAVHKGWRNGAITWKEVAKGGGRW